MVGICRGTWPLKPADLPFYTCPAVTFSLAEKLLHLPNLESDTTHQLPQMHKLQGH